MDVIIHTYGRATRSRQYTLNALVAAGIEVVLVVQEREAHLYKTWPVELYVLPPKYERLAPTRDHIIHDMGGSDHVVFMDDDLHFAVRRPDDPTKFRQPRPNDLYEMIWQIDRSLRSFPMVGIGPREGGNRNTEEFLTNTRIMRVLAFRRSYLKKHGITFTPLEVMEDFHVNLQILRSGADTCVCNRWVSNQAEGSDAPGGCSTYRSEAVQSAAAHMLAARHPGFVRVVQKATKGAWGGGTRTDVVVQWKKARESAS